MNLLSLSVNRGRTVTRQDTRGDARVVSPRAPTTLTQFYFPIIITILLSKVTEIVERWAKKKIQPGTG